ncbi:protein-S-isoprenylcysteine O-methyltransferase Ste14 [Mycolicibacterium sp. BK556]|uniref:DoxX family protein n=1 Tax=unclassified Mycolicibacterium TaxID=2636767 RepID=UPI00161A8124|nr:MULTISPECIES: DoxX family protein [unclassified Mycolicibacterium]MBB3604755.1 protein-S-isoprenylcysteine O-methyltransferase Ste14 [Mycolicibacterium sp. BK556]MBB3634532.1 protein-S-isoprenylcysteine O-methyltransferase Ste14 [Mycolicibacterium sp. BK607]
MNTVLWVAAAVLAVAFAVGGASQILLSKARYRALSTSQHWVDDFTPGHIKAIGTIKLVGATGLVLPPLIGVVPVLAPLAATGLMVFMGGAATTRFRRSEWVSMLGDVLFICAFAFVAWGRFELHPFT